MTKSCSSNDGFVSLDDDQEANWEVVERVLFVYAKLNPGHGYVQVCLSIDSFICLFVIKFCKRNCDKHIDRYKLQPNIWTYLMALISVVT